MDELLELVKLMAETPHGVKFRIWNDPDDGECGRGLHFDMLLHEDWPKMETQRGKRVMVPCAGPDAPEPREVRRTGGFADAGAAEDAGRTEKGQR